MCAHRQPASTMPQAQFYPVSGHIVIRLPSTTGSYITADSDKWTCIGRTGFLSGGNSGVQSQA